MRSDFTRALEHCPACLGTALEADFLVSKAGLLSQPGHPHSRCTTCGSVHLDPRPTAEELTAFYESSDVEADVSSDVARQSADRILDPERRRYFVEHRVEPLSRHLPDGGRIFDVGCGVGAFVRAMKDRGYSIRGNDLSAVSIEAGRDLLGLSEQDIFVGPAREIPGEGFDAVTLWTVIEHLPDPEDYLSVVRSKVDAGGLLLLEFPTVDSLMFREMPDDFRWVMPPYHLSLYSVAGMTSMLERCGFDLVEEHRMPRNWGFFDALAGSSGMEPDLRAQIQNEAPAFTYRLDRLLDDVALRLGESSSVQLIARNSGSSPHVA